MAFHDTIKNIPFGGELKSVELNGILNAIHENTLTLRDESTALSENIEQTVSHCLTSLQDGLTAHEIITGSENLHGHVTLTDDIESTARAVDGVGMSPFGLAKLRAELTEKMYSTLDFPAHVLIRAVSAEEGDGGVPDIPFSVTVNQEPEMIYTTKADGAVKAAGLGGDSVLIKPAQGIMWTSTPEFVAVDLKAEDTVEVEFALEPIPVGYVKIVAERSTGVRLSGRKFTVTVSGEAAKTLTTDTNGEISIETDPGKTVTVKPTDLGLCATVSPATSTATIVGGQTADAKFVYTAEIGKVLSYTSSTTITLDALITSIDVEGESGSGGGGGALGYSSRGGDGGNATKSSVLSKALQSNMKTLTITVGSQGYGGAGTELPNVAEYYGKDGTSGGVTSVVAGGTALISCPGGGAGKGGLKIVGSAVNGAKGSPSGNGQAGGMGGELAKVGVETMGKPGGSGVSGYVKITIKG